MASFSSSRSFFAVTIAVFLCAAASHARLLHRVGHLSEHNPCEKSSYLSDPEFYPKFCHSVASSGSFKTEKDFALAAMSKAVDELNAGIATVGKAIEAEPQSATGRGGYLRNCQGYYSQGIDELQGLRDHLIGNATAVDGSTREYSLADIKNFLSAASTDVSTCSTEWDEAFGAPFPIKEVDAHLNKVLSCLFTLTSDWK